MNFKSKFLSIFSKRKSNGIFIPTKLGYKELQKKFDHKTIHSISEHLGYHPDQVYAFITSGDIHAFVFEIFTENLIFILTENNVTEEDTSKLNSYKKLFDPSYEYNALNSKDILQNGIKNHSLTTEYLARVLSIKNAESDGIFFVEKLGMFLYFLDGYLVDFQSSDGLNEWAKNFKELNPDFIRQYATEAAHYWGNNTPKIINEVNLQAFSLAEIPGTFKNEFIQLHKTSFGTINFAMLLVCHYNKGITLDEFIEINHGRYFKLSDNSTSIKKYKLNLFTYEFYSNGLLKSVYRN